MIPTLSKHQLFQSHLVNCDICRKYESAGIAEVSEGVWQSTVREVANRRMCPVGVKLFNEALKEEPNKSPFRPKSFPYVAKMYETVRFRHTGSIEWIQGKVIDRSIGANQRVMGYEVEVITKSRFEGVRDRQEQYYVNPNNIKPLVTWQEKQEKVREQVRVNELQEIFEEPEELEGQPEPQVEGKFKFHVGGQ